MVVMVVDKDSEDEEEAEQDPMGSSGLVPAVEEDVEVPKKGNLLQVLQMAESF